jgi:hypothetical protein
MIVQMTFSQDLDRPIQANDINMLETKRNLRGSDKKKAVFLRLSLI